MKKIRIILFLIALIFSLPIIGCASQPAQYKTEIINLEEGSIALIKPAEGTQINPQGTNVENLNGWALITANGSARTALLLPSNSLPNVIKLVKEGTDECPGWAVGKVTYSRCSVTEKPVYGEKIK